MLGVASGKTITVPHGEECFYLNLADTTGGTKSKATVTGLRIPHVTSELPMLQLQQAWDELQAEAWREDKRFNLPKVDGRISGTGVDVIIGIKYLKHYPELLLTGPSGLCIYKAKLLSASGNQAVLGGLGVCSRPSPAYQPEVVSDLGSQGVVRGTELGGDQQRQAEPAADVHHGRAGKQRQEDGGRGGWPRGRM